MEENINEALMEKFYSNKETKELFNKLQKEVENGKINLYQATELLLNNNLC
jgi:polyhydroxyalkanoate synthesis regulator phasin